MMDKYGYIGIETLLNYCENSKEHAVTPNEFMRMNRVRMPEQRWIPVTERLPEYGTEVVTINKDDEYEINHVVDEEDGEWFFNGAVAWMPLPEPYAERRQDADR